MALRMVTVTAQEDGNALYECRKCKARFVAMHFRAVRLATGSCIEHCGLGARWIQNVGKGDTVRVTEEA